MNNNKKQVKNIQELIEALFPSNKECYLCGYKGSMIGLIGHECKSSLEIPNYDRLLKDPNNDKE